MPKDKHSESDDFRYKFLCNTHVRSSTRMTSIDFSAMLREERLKSRVKKVRPIFDQHPPLRLSDFKLDPRGVYYIENFISIKEEQSLLDEIYKPSTKDEDKWVTLTKRRLKNLGGTPHPDGMLSCDMPEYIKQLLKVLSNAHLEVKDVCDIHDNPSYNQILLNEYIDGRGISFHKDGDLYLPVALILNMSSPALIEFRKTPTSTTEFSVLMKPKSLLIFTDDAYNKYYHGIKDSDFDVVDESCINMNALAVGDTIKRNNKRVSLTIRSCPKVLERKFSQHHKEEEARMRSWWLSSISEKASKSTEEA
ncbi:alpha-ketoglutarate-dependent dioxygenase alkB [Acrasis kona]|uniref:Alpha-ketoglutarate-dependent dioxygenase alkB n=1 Tax=Acrasis kona TaxID=1008807 RepID=A0AAW2ZGP0_9EUKA